MALTHQSPPVRIGMLRHRDIVRCRIEGKCRLEDAQGHALATVDDESGQLEFRPESAKPAVVQWRSVLCKSPTPHEAEEFASGLPALSGGQRWETEVVGTTWPTPDGGQLDNREWWVHSPPFPTAEACRAWCLEKGVMTLVINPSVRHPPQGAITCHAGGITSTGLTTGGLLRLVPIDSRGSRVALENVIVGVGFHWQHLETQWLRGSVEVQLDDEGKLTVVNELPLEEYLMALVGSEMKAQMPHELLKVQAVCARNTTLATAGKHHRGEGFDLCADDHCQCYRGSTRETAESREAALSTWGEVLVAGDRLCDTRYSKICGGIAEAAHSVWGGPKISYMIPISDFPHEAPDRVLPPINTEEKARDFVTSSPPAFCNCGAREVPEYLKYAAKYFRWTEELTREEIENLLARWPERRVGEVRELVPRVRGASGRIEELAVLGSEGECVIHRELPIRQALSPTTLYSSCFVVDHAHEPDGRLRAVTLHGAGWGHGAGMCQIGAAVMALEGYTHDQILAHYFVGTSLRLSHDRPTNWGAMLALLDDGEFAGHDRCWERTNCYEVVGCPVYEKLVGAEKGYVKNAERTEMYLDCPEFKRQKSEGVV